MEDRTAPEMMTNRPTIEKRLEAIMEEVHQTRGDDVLLTFHYLRRYVPHVRLSYANFKDLLFCISFESLSRCRRRVQKKRPDLLPTKRVIHKRGALDQAHKDYYAPLSAF